MDVKVREIEETTMLYVKSSEIFNGWHWSCGNAERFSRPASENLRTRGLSLVYVDGLEFVHEIQDQRVGSETVGDDIYMTLDFM